MFFNVLMRTNSYKLLKEQVLQCYVTMRTNTKEKRIDRHFDNIFSLGLGRISGMAGYPAGYPAIFTIRPDTGY